MTEQTDSGQTDSGQTDSGPTDSGPTDRPTDPRAALNEMVEGHTDEEINAMAADVGVETLVGSVFEGMAAAFVAERAAGQAAVIQWDVTAPDATHSYQLKVADGACAATPGAPDTPRVTLALALPDFLRFVAGKLDGMQAFMTGKLKLTGDVMFAQTMQSWFDRNR